MDDAVKRVNKICRDFAGVLQSATEFIAFINEKLASENMFEKELF